MNRRLSGNNINNDNEDFFSVYSLYTFRERREPGEQVTICGSTIFPRAIPDVHEDEKSRWEFQAIAQTRRW